MRQPESPSLPPGTEGIRFQFAPAPAPPEGRLVFFGTCALAADASDGSLRVVTCENCLRKRPR